MTQLELEGDSTSSIPPEAKTFTAKAKAIAVVITAVTALVTAVTALVKVTDTSLQQASYEELSKNVQKVSEDSGKNHDDIKAIRDYLDRDREARKDVVAAVEASAVPSSVPVVPLVVASSSSKSPKSVKKPVLVVPPPLPPPPIQSPKPPPRHPAEFKEVEKAAAAAK